MIPFLLWVWFIVTLVAALYYRKGLLRVVEETHRNAPPLRYQLRRWYRRHRAEVSGIGFLLFLIACYLLLAFVYA